MKNKKKWIIVLVLIVLLLLFIILYLLFGREKSFRITFDTNGGTNISSIEVKNNEIVKLPETPSKEGYKFVAWTNEEGKVITEGTKVTKDIILKAIWIKKGVEIVTVKFDTDGGNNIRSIIIENGKVILLPINPTKEGYVFIGWVDENGNAITKDTIVNKNITIKALWKEPYTCPSGCMPIGDGSKCTKVVTKGMVNKTSCPSGYTLKNGQCLDVSHQYHANSIDVSPWWSCNSSSEYMYTEIDESGIGAVMWCAKKANKVTSKGCPSGYTQNGDVCTKTETIKCTAN